MCAVTKRYKLVFSANDEPWLVDVKKNPDETINLFGDPKHSETVRALTASLLEYTKMHDDVFAREPKIRATMMLAAAK